MWCSKGSSRTGFSLSGLSLITLRRVLSKMARMEQVWTKDFSAWEETKEDKERSQKRQAEAGPTGVAARPALAFVRLIAVLLFLALPVRATTYYIAAAGSDSNNGTTTGTPWAHAPGMPGCASTCAGVTLQPGDSVLFNRGDAWYGQTLTAPASGSSGSPLTFGAYGTGADPILKGSTLLTTSGYTLAPNQVTTIF